MKISLKRLMLTIGLVLAASAGGFAQVAITSIAPNLGTTAGGTIAALPATGTGYTLDTIGFQITRYDMPQSYYDACLLYTSDAADE